MENGGFRLYALVSFSILRSFSIISIVWESGFTWRRNRFLTFNLYSVILTLHIVICAFLRRRLRNPIVIVGELTHSLSCNPEPAIFIQISVFAQKWIVRRRQKVTRTLSTRLDSSVLQRFSIKLR